MNTEKRNVVRWQDGTYDPYHVPSFKRQWIGPYGVVGELLSDEVETTNGYWEWAETNLPKDEDGMVVEGTLANPDSLTSTELLEDQVLSSESIDSLRNQAYLQLTEKQKEVWDLCMRQGQTENQAAISLKISRTTVQDRLNAAKIRFAEYLRLNQ